MSILTRISGRRPPLFHPLVPSVPIGIPASPARIVVNLFLCVLFLFWTGFPAMAGNLPGHAVLIGVLAKRGKPQCERK